MPRRARSAVASPAVAGGKVVIGGSDSHRLEALDAKTGAPVWSVDTGARVLGSATIAGNVVLYGAEDFRVHAADLVAIVSADGSLCCPYLFGMRGRIERQVGRPASALTLSLFGQEIKAKRVD